MDNKMFTSIRKHFVELQKTDVSFSDVKQAGSQLIKNSSFTEEEVESWAKWGNGYTRVANARRELVPGFYVAYSTMAGTFLTPFGVSHDDILDLPDQKTSNIVSKANEFWDLGETFKGLGFMHKRGILLDGKPGTGKSIIAFKVAKSLVENHGGIVIYPTDPWTLVQIAKDFRNVQPETKLLVVIEDIDEWCYSYGEKTLTAFLDGEHKIDNLLVIATTNNKKAISSRLLKRPSRFDVKETIGVLTKEGRKSFLTQKATSLTAEQIQNWADKTEGYTVPMLKELMILVLAYCYPLENSLARIKKDFADQFPDE